jgi:hypothetical protein
VARARTKRVASKRHELVAYLEQEQPGVVTEEHWETLRERLRPVSESYLRRLLRSCGYPLAPLVEGVRQDSLEALERSLRALTVEYESAASTERRKLIRGLVITAKEHARMASNRLGPCSALARGQKQEMILWMLTWLNDPGVFPVWGALRKRLLREQQGSGCEPQME